MFGVFTQWYKRKFSDPNALMLLLLILITTVILLIWGNILMPVIVAAVIAYLLDWPVSKMNRRGINRTAATAITLTVFIVVSILLMIGLVPVIYKQSVNLAQELPLIWNSGQEWVISLPERYPELVQVEYIKNTMDSVNQHLVSFGQQVISVSVNSIGNLAALLIYMILVPLMVFFMLKDKQLFLASISNVLPKERRLITQVGEEMNTQIANYIRGKVIEIIIVGGVTSAAFAFMELRYALLLGVLVGFSVLIPYIGAAVVTIPVAIVALFQFGLTSDFWYLMLVYAIIQALDGNLIVPILFSEAVSLHPLYIIIAVLVFGGMWGFWGVFFAIPLATLVKAVISAWSTPTNSPEAMLKS
ncbi:AI-2E family transporter [Glaciecola sp. MH2013]|uniref:AI-2E family transporter n=1 Tax=Glaciecola sp. MH2013 TaxID=2785524 RepID=UPI00189E683E|nr:AI-2E family transporter [Glaciecola sp. MH2013]MBF7072874.1 AI-2E family transporter [Glaciecola sp. MH2013]